LSAFTALPTSRIVLPSTRTLTGALGSGAVPSTMRALVNSVEAKILILLLVPKTPARGVNGAECEHGCRRLRLDQRDKFLEVAMIGLRGDDGSAALHPTGR